MTIDEARFLVGRLRSELWTVEARQVSEDLVFKVQWKTLNAKAVSRIRGEALCSWGAGELLLFIGSMAKVVAGEAAVNTAELLGEPGNRIPVLGREWSASSVNTDGLLRSLIEECPEEARIMGLFP